MPYTRHPTPYTRRQRAAHGESDGGEGGKAVAEMLTDVCDRLQTWMEEQVHLYLTQYIDQMVSLKATPPHTRQLNLITRSSQQ